MEPIGSDAIINRFINEVDQPHTKSTLYVAIENYLNEAGNASFNAKELHSLQALKEKLQGKPSKEVAGLIHKINQIMDRNIRVSYLSPELQGIVFNYMPLEQVRGVDTPLIIDWAENHRTSIIRMGLRPSEMEPLLKRRGDRLKTLRGKANDLWTIQNLMRLTPNLSTVTLEGAKITPREMDKFRKMDHLVELNLKNCKVRDAAALKLGEIPSLESINLTKNKVGPSGLQGLTQLPNLYDLNLSKNNLGEGLSELAHCRGLEILDISETGVTNEALQALSTLPELYDLTLADTTFDVGELARFEKLEHLVLNKANRETFGNIKPVLARLRKLETLSLPRGAIGDREAPELAQLVNLEKLFIRGKPPACLTEVGAAALANLTQLTHLNLEFHKIGDKGAAHLAKLKELKALFLVGNDLTSAGIAHLTGLTQLQTLYLENNPIDDEAIPHLAKLHNLKTLTLFGTNLSQEGIAALQAALPHTQILDDFSDVDSND